MAKNKKNTGLSEEDARIWEKITLTANPINPAKTNWAMEKRAIPKNLISTNEHFNKGGKSATAWHQTAGFIPQPSYYPPTSQLALVSRELDQKTKRKISKGKTAIQGKIDLHGLTQTQAHRQLYDFLEYSYYADRKIILVVTGKGMGGQGILRESVPRWLNEPDFRKIVSSFGASQPNHGGEGALYVRIKRRSSGGADSI